MSYLDRIRVRNHHDLTDFTLFRIQTRITGHVRVSFVRERKRWPRVFIVSE